jgi:hypothetical protein
VTLDVQEHTQFRGIHYGEGLSVLGVSGESDLLEVDEPTVESGYVDGD